VTEPLNPIAVGEPTPLAGRESADLAQRRSKLEKLLGKQMRSFTALFAQVFSDEDADAVHDLRVCTRRLQQQLSTLVPDQTIHKARTIRRTLREVRRAVGKWRNCDVALQWVSRAERRTANPHRRRGWALVRESIAAQRKHAINKARRRLLKSDGLTVSQRTQQLIALPPQRLGSANQDGVVRASIADASIQWHQVLARAIEDRSAQNIHAFRIQLKRMRYRVELARDLGAADAKPLIEWFKALQDRLGRWHDRQELNHFITGALANSEVLLKQPRVAVDLLKEVERDITISSRLIDVVFQLATASEGSDQFERWIKSYSGSGDNGLAREPAWAPLADHIGEDQVADNQIGHSAPILAEPAPAATEPLSVETPPSAQELTEHHTTDPQSEGEAKH